MWGECCAFVCLWIELLALRELLARECYASGIRVLMHYHIQEGRFSGLEFEIMAMIYRDPDQDILHEASPNRLADNCRTRAARPVLGS